MLNLLHLYKICLLVSIKYMSYGHEKFSLEKNLRQYLPMGIWLTIALVTLVYNELKWPNCCNYRLPLIFNGLIEFRSLSNKFRKFLSLKSAAWKNILYCKRTESHFLFLQKSYRDLHRKIGTKSKLLKSLFTKACSSHFYLVGQSQNSIWSLAFFKKKSLSL